MTDEEIRSKVRERLKTGVLPRNRPMPVKLGSGQAIQESQNMQVGLVRGHQCSACDADDPYVTYRYPDKEIKFHEKCEQIWNEECEKLSPN